jgi:methanogenic corrinoid protein MtbC1
MHSIKIHLEQEEFQPLARLAEQLKLDPADIVYAGLNRVMQQVGDAAMQQEILLLKSARQTQLPNWADRAREIHAYESMT